MQPLSLRPALDPDQHVFDLSAIEEASRTISPYIKRTPLMYAALETCVGQRVDLALKLDNLQVGGSAHVRGLLNAVLHAPDETVARGIATVCFGGEHYAAAAVYVAGLLEVPVSVYVSHLASQDRLAKYRAPRMQTHVHGESWESAARYAEAQAAAHNQIFLHPFADPLIVAGFGTAGLEIIDAPMKPTVVVVPAYSSGGELCGIGAAIKSVDPSVRVVGVETQGAARLSESLQQGRPTRIPTHGGPRRPSSLAFDLTRRFVDEIVVVTPAETRHAVQTLWRELEVSASLSAATAVAAVLAGKIRVASHERLLTVVTGTGNEGLF